MFRGNYKYHVLMRRQPSQATIAQYLGRSPAALKPADVSRELLCLGAGQHHAGGQRMKKPALGNPAPPFHQFLMQDCDLAGPPKLMKPSLNQNQNASEKDTGSGETATEPAPIASGT